MGDIQFQKARVVLPQCQEVQCLVPLVVEVLYCKCPIRL